MHEDRLERLAALLDRNAANPKGAKFDLSCWVQPSDKREAGDRYATFNTRLSNVPMDCGTTACALGLAAISGEFAKEGLTFSMYGSADKGFILEPTFVGEDGFDAGAQLFGITYEDSKYLFDPDCYETTPKGAEGELFVAQRIRDFIAGNIDEMQYPED